MKIKNWEFYSFIFFIMQACLIGFTIDDLLFLLDNNAWIIPIIGSFIGYFLLKIYLFIFNSNKKITDLIYQLFNKKISILLILIILILIILIMNSVFLMLINFISNEYLYDTPPLFIIILITTTILYVIHNKTNALFRTSLILFYLIIIIFTIVTAGLIRQIDFYNLKPWFNFKISNLLVATFNYLMYTTAPLFIIAFYKKKDIQKVTDKGIIKTYFFSHLTSFIIIFTLVAVLGPHLAKLYQFPGYHILKRTFAGAFIERLEKILAIYWIISMIVPIIFLGYTVIDIIKNNFKIKKTSYLILAIILLSNFFLLSNIDIITKWNENLFPIVLSINIPIMIIILKKLKKLTKS